ncbi:MAG: hypothetical protein LBC70_04600 [Chitinispirillales bacterium]|nr:hypothetical protein [Chitinispirillales bacterium]
MTEISGAASGALDSDSPQADEHAKRYYEAIRNRTSDSDVTRIAKNTNFSEKVVKQIKNHVFLDVHNLGGGKMGRFTPEYDMALAWDRLIQGTYTELDITLLKHELVELTQMRCHGYDYNKAHDIANIYHNWALEKTLKKMREAKNE